MPLDHFRFTVQKRFTLRYAAFEAFAVNRPKAPVLFYCGNEGALELFYNASGALFEHAKAIQARVFFVEHRYYGHSLPFGNASFTNDALQWLSIEQALADYASVLAALPGILGCVGTGSRQIMGRCDAILFGGSYGGMLAAWHRLKYPFLSVGAIASGAPIDFYSKGWRSSASDDADDAVQSLFLDAVVQTFETYGRAGGGCGVALRRVLAAADNATNDELITAGVRPCHAWRADSVERYAFYAKGAVADVALVDYPYPTNFIAPLPANPVQPACEVLMAGAHSHPHADVEKLPRAASLHSLHRAVLGLVNASGDLKCINLQAELVGQPSRSAVTLSRDPIVQRDVATRTTSPSVASSALGVTAWNYQACTELLLEPLTSDGFGFFPPSRGQIGETRALCAKTFGIEPRPTWMPLAFGAGQDFGHVASNIVFMENDKDPWHIGTRTVPARGGVNGSVVRMVAKGGAHHQDLRFSSAYDAPDVKKAREVERDAMRRWLSVS